MDEGPVTRRREAGFKPRIRGAVRRVAPRYYFPAYAAHLARMANAGYEPPDDRRFNILVVNHYFDQDVAWLRRAATDVGVFEVPFSAFSHAAAAVLPEEAERFPGYYAPEFAEGRAAYAEHLGRIFDRLSEDFPYDAVITTSDFFWWSREFQPVLGERAIPYFVLEKEGLMSPFFYEHYSREFRQHSPPTPDHVLVWSDRQALFWELCGQDADKISAVGQPRSDFWSHPETWPQREDLGLPLRPGAPLVVYFSYDIWFYLSYEAFERGEFTWEDVRNGTNQAFLDAAARHPEADFVVKLHPQQAESGLEDTELPPNVQVVGGATLGNPLLLNADVLVMFQSTATIEAMFRDIPIVYTFFGQSIEPHVKSLLPFHEHPDILTVTTSEQGVIAGIEQGLSSPRRDAEAMSRRLAFINDYLYCPDGNASRRVLDRIGELIQHRGADLPDVVQAA